MGLRSMTDRAYRCEFEIGAALDILGTIPDQTFHCCVTSPPYWGLRSYLPADHPDKAKEIGLEATPEEYVENLVAVFREVRRVLRDDGTLWLVLGDSYAGSGPSGARYGSRTTRRRDGQGNDGKFRLSKTLADRGMSYDEKKPIPPPGLKSKDLVGIPWRVAFALQADGWWLRSDIVWAKPNPMPESVTDRPTRSHEYVFLLSKSARYAYDGDAIAEPTVSTHDSGNGYERPERPYHGNGQPDVWKASEHPTRNKRSVWRVCTVPYPGSHFAAMPPKLVEPCILAGCPEGGIVLDPFLGTGTVAMVAESLGRVWYGIDLNPEYADHIAKRTAQPDLFVSLEVSAE